MVVYVAVVLFLTAAWLITWFTYAHAASKPVSRFRVVDRDFIFEVYEVCSRVRDVLTQHNLFYCLSAGAALGSARACAPLSHDDDVDFFVLKQDLARIRTILEAHPDKFFNVHLADFGLQFDVVGCRPYVDLFALEKCPDGSYRYDGHFDRNRDYLTAEDIQNVALLPFGNTRVHQLKDPKPYLARHYGSDWDSVCVVRCMHRNSGLSFLKCLGVWNVYLNDRIV